MSDMFTVYNIFGYDYTIWHEFFPIHTYISVKQLTTIAVRWILKRWNTEKRKLKKKDVNVMELWSHHQVE